MQKNDLIKIEDTVYRVLDITEGTLTWTEQDICRIIDGNDFLLSGLAGACHAPVIHLRKKSCVESRGSSLLSGCRVETHARVKGEVPCPVKWSAPATSYWVLPADDTVIFHLNPGGRESESDSKLKGK